ncbi:exopolysaccharide biosynthesis polyprenyl glycosylphosphotransferase [Ramlibacter sp. XY19]|uniref:sugar transferase n=1 Tax=Ramlibacter paludis TaxID=2908000 RepID=UPI0023DC311A|nr:exopolysaccharide biosynthesis polyprenyl glycosylphosphotransferase [Ramlibacter paludis]MCG2592033.1 exopolysaccharide biosynthesis polyprenyl glycosylphosphotransferase [Ramlibacter paludis]
MYRINEELTTPATVPDRLREEQVALGALGRCVKRGCDVAGAVFFLVLFSPLLLAVIVGIKLTSRGPVIYSQPRIGRGGRSFHFYKFRSMVSDADQVLTSFLDTDSEARQQWDQYQKLENDPRITPFGRFIRRTSLDELPQLWNVLVGDMSVVGPRPCMPNQKRLYGVYWPSYCAVRPGLTGLWQVSGRNRLTYAERVRLDASYVKNWSLWLDFKILVKTIRVVLTGDGSR